MAAGAVWLPLESYEGITSSDVSISFGLFVLIVVITGLLFFFVEGYFISGVLRKKIKIKSKSFNTKITVEFGDLFSKKGWKAVGVNDFFDSVVDDDLVSANSLHGHVIQNYWSDDSAVWQAAVDNSLHGVAFKKTKRAKGNRNRYPIGTTANAQEGENKFLFVALARTRKSTNVVQASAETLIGAIRGMLQHARAVCSNEPLSIPLMGSGLGRIGIKDAILVDLILAAIFEESQSSKITDSISIVLPKEKQSEINLGAISRDWK